MACKFLAPSPDLVSDAIDRADAYAHYFAIVFDCNESAFAFKLLNPSEQAAALIIMRIDLILLQYLPALSAALDKALTIAAGDAQVLTAMNLLLDNKQGTPGYGGFVQVVTSRINSLIANEMDAPAKKKGRRK